MTELSSGSRENRNVQLERFAPFPGGRSQRQHTRGIADAAGQRRLGVHGRHGVLQLVAEAEGATGLVVAAARDVAARQRLVFEPAGVALQIQSVPYTRSIGLVQRGEADAWVGSYLNEVDDGVFYPRLPYDADQIGALGLTEQPLPSLANLGEFRLVWIRGYEYQRYLPNLHDYREVQRRSGILGMLDLGHADFYIDALTEVEELLASTSAPQRYRSTVLTALPLYLGFADNPRGRALAELYDRRMELLLEEDRLREVFVRWQQPYPFD